MSQPDVARYTYGPPLDFTPETANHYSNFGYLLAGAVVEHVSGVAYAAYVNKTLLQPAGINEVQVISTLASLRSSNEAIAEDQGLGLSPLNLTYPLISNDLEKSAEPTAAAWRGDARSPG